MSSISKSFGVKNKYKPLKILPPQELKKARNVVLLVLDGLGYEYLKRKKSSFLNKSVTGKITSVFLSTTASAITTFGTGVAPQQHAYTGWFMYLKELGLVSTILPFVPRAGGPVLSKLGLNVEQVIGEKSFASKIKTKSYFVMPDYLKNSNYTKNVSKKSKMLAYNGLDGLFRQIKNAIKSGGRRKYIYSYWPKFDSYSHEFGINSKKTAQHFNEIDSKLKKFIGTVKNTNTILLITADHGQVDTTKKSRLLLESHPKLKECLTLPLCGDARVSYCYVKPSKAKQFEKYVKNKLSKVCWLRKSSDMVKKNYFGLFKPNPKLFDRIGDYALIMKKNYTFKDRLANEKREINVGDHGGVSKDEMFVPLIVIKA
jgi:predicted AlkP superfamily pyrophosphatase or phosphodiesterase